MARYSVVEFNDKTAAIICNSWFVGEEEEYCLWPNEQSNKIGRLAKAEQQPCIDWKKYRIRVLGKAGSYERALEKLRMCEETSDLNTDVEESSHKRRRIRNRKYMASDSDSDSSVIDDPPARTQDDLPSPPSSLVGVSGVSAATLSPPATSSSSRSLPFTSTPSRTESLEDASILTNVVQHHDCELIRKLASHIYSVQETLQIHTSMLQNLLKKVSGVVTEAATLPEGLKFPLETVDQLEEMETHLIDPGVRTGLVNVLGEIGGRNVDECVKRVMKFIMGDILATKLNMSGRNNKKAFGSTNLFETVYRGVKQNSQTSDSTRRNVEHAVAKWLIGGRDRGGNRMQRVTGTTVSAN